MKLTISTHYQVRMTLMLLRRSLGQKVKVIQRNLVNSIAPGPLKGSEPKLQSYGFDYVFIMLKFALMFLLLYRRALMFFCMNRCTLPPSLTLHSQPHSTTLIHRR